MNTTLDKIDRFSFIDNLQTTARQLNIFTVIIQHLNNKQLPKKILEQLLVAWSAAEEGLNPSYLEAKGKITNNGKKTAALGYYIQISPALGLTSRFNDVYMNTRVSQTFLYFISNKSESETGLSISEKLFYLFMLIEHDADGMIMCLNQLFNSKEKKQTLLQTEFKDAMSARLLSKMDVSPPSIKSKISDKYRAINFIWKKSKKYAEHIIAPRYEWLSDIGLVKIKRESKDTLYSLTPNGELFYNALPTFSSNGLKDINTNWINSSLFSVCASIIEGVSFVKYSDLNAEQQDNELGESLGNAARAVKSSTSFRLPAKELQLFVCLDLFVTRNVLIEFNDIQNKLKNGFSFQSKAYQLKLAGRANEGYLTIRLNR